MKKKITTVVCMLVLITPIVSYSQTSSDVLHNLYRQSVSYKMGVNTGYGLSVAGLVLAPLGLSLVTLNLSLSNVDYAGKNIDALTQTGQAGYAILGTGIVSLIVGIIIWRNQEKKYMSVIDRQYRYKDFIGKGF